ncbi:MAG: TIM-barrel domain-containing protein [Croceibacterium sp.]
MPKTGSSFRLVAAALLAPASTTAYAEGTWRATNTGVIVTPDEGSERAVRLQVYGDGLIRVTATPDAQISMPESLMVRAEPKPSGFTVKQGSGLVVLSTPSASAEVSLADGNVTFRNARGEIVLAESGPAGFAPVTAEGQPFLAVRQRFNRGTDEGFYGLGQHQNRQMNYNGEDVELAQHNMDIAVPFVVSTRGYGVLWDNNSITRFGDPDPYPFAGGMADGLHVTGADGERGWTAVYSVDGREIARRSEATIDLKYLENRKDWPAGTRTETNGGTVPGLQVTWTGTVTPSTGGLHKFRLYSSHYAKVFVAGKQVLDRWRQNWNPWYHNFETELAAGEPVAVRIEWQPNAGYIALMHNDPLPEEDRHSLSFASEFGHALDYYFVAGKDADGVISGYRTLTGDASLLPRWAYGFWQSRQRYKTQDEVLGVLREYRRRELPLDNIVVDWQYWPDDSWGCHCFDPVRFPQPQAMIDEIHERDARVMISVWPKFYPSTEHFKQLDAIGGIHRRQVEPRPDEPTDADYIQGMYRDWVGPGYPNAFYDPYNPAARELYWQQIRDSLAVKGIDAWWLDSDEPDFHSNLSIIERKRRMGPTARGLGDVVFNSYPLVHVDGVHDNLVEYRPDTRPFILTRSGFGGIQRAGAALWSGDVVATWDNLRDQISAGINVSLSGVPNWTHDIGGFALEDRFTNQDPAHIEEWRELYLRWFQFGAFTPLFRSHGEFPFREVWETGPEGSASYEAQAFYSRLRYGLMPYIYTLAADTYHRDGTIMRGLVMDFAADRRVWDIDDQYMFGPAFLVAPVTEFKARSRKVYLPQGALWYDFYSGESRQGGQAIEAAAPYERMPLFVRAGSIVPAGPPVQSTAQIRPDAPITLWVYTGADGSFSLYEDDGVSRQHLDSAFTRIPIAYDEKSGTLTLGEREGRFPDMAAERTIHLRWMRPGAPRALDLDAAPDATIAYDGRRKTVQRPR